MCFKSASNQIPLMESAAAGYVRERERELVGKVVRDRLPQARQRTRRGGNLTLSMGLEVFGVNVCRVWLEIPHAQSNFVI